MKKTMKSLKPQSAEPRAPADAAALPTVDNVSRAFELLGEYQELREVAIQDLLTQQKEIQAKLRGLGYEEAALPGAVTVAPMRRTAGVSGKPCKVCGQTGHDARKHRFEKQRESEPPTG